MMARCKGTAHCCQSCQRNRDRNQQPADGNVPGSDQVGRTAHRQRQDRRRQGETRPSTEHAGGDLGRLSSAVLRAEAAMAKAEKLAETNKRDAKQNRSSAPCCRTCARR